MSDHKVYIFNNYLSNLLLKKESFEKKLLCSSIELSILQNAEWVFFLFVFFFFALIIVMNIHKCFEDCWGNLMLFIHFFFSSVPAVLSCYLFLSDALIKKDHVMLFFKFLWWIYQIDFFLWKEKCQLLKRELTTFIKSRRGKINTFITSQTEDFKYPMLQAQKQLLL